MCSLYSITTNQAAISALFRVVNRYVGNLATMPGVFPDYKAPIVRAGADGRELATARWGMPSSQHARRRRKHRNTPRHLACRSLRRSRGRLRADRCERVGQDFWWSAIALDVKIREMSLARAQRATFLPRY